MKNKKNDITPDAQNNERETTVTDGGEYVRSERIDVDYIRSLSEKVVRNEISGPFYGTNEECNLFDRFIVAAQAKAADLQV